MNYFNISLLIGGLVGLLSAVLVYSKNRHISYNRAWFRLNIATAIWSFGYFLMITSNNHDISWYSNWVLHFAAALIPSLFLYFVASFVGKVKNYKIPLIISFSLSSFFLLVTPSKFFISDVVPKFIFNYVCDAGPLYLYFTIFFFAVVSYSLLLLLLRLRTAKGILAQQVKYIFLTSVFGFAGGGSVFFLTFNVNFPPYPVILFSFYPLVITYAITRYRVFNIKYFITRSILYTVLVATVASFFALAVVVVGNAVGGNTQTSKIFTYIITSFIVVVFLDPVKQVWAKITDRVFYRDKVDYQEVLREIGSVVAREINLYKLLEGTSQLLAERLKIKEISSFVLSSKEEFSFLINSDEKVEKFNLSERFINYLKQTKKILIIDELIRDLGRLDEKRSEYKEISTFIKEAETYKAEMIIPVIENDNISAILIFGAKQSGDVYGQDDINFLEVLTPQIATAIEKSKLYEEVEQFNKELQQKVDDRTKSLSEVNAALEERNKFLSTIQVVINMISQTLDLKKVNQMIADSISTELGYVGGMLTFVDDKHQYLQVGAITNSAQTRKAFQILSKEPREYRTKLEENFNLSAQTFLTGKINFSDKLSDFMNPPVKKEEVDKIQKTLGIKTIVGVPVVSEAKIIGVIQYYLPIKKDAISSLDIEIMSALNNQVGIVSRNLKLYNTLQGANAELQDANTRLRELDKAKSEFLSIASHQLRTPISAIKGYLSMMIDGDFGPLPKNINDVIKNLFESSARLARLINIFLNVSRIESGRLKLDKKPIQINDMIDSVIIELINQAKQKGVKLEYKKKKKAPPLILADADKLREVVLNLVDNSIKYTPKGSIIVTVDADDRELNFKVTDTGIGIDKKEVKTLFRKFVRGSGVAQIHTGGSGLGLFIAQKIIKEHNGQVWAESEGSGKGSVFQFTIPVYKEHETPAYKEEAEEK